MFSFLSQPEKKFLPNRFRFFLFSYTKRCKLLFWLWILLLKLLYILFFIEKKASFCFGDKLKLITKFRHSSRCGKYDTTKESWQAWTRCRYKYWNLSFKNYQSFWHFQSWLCVSLESESSKFFSKKSACKNSHKIAILLIFLATILSAY